MFIRRHCLKRFRQFQQALSSVCTRYVSVTLVHPAKAVGRNEMPFGMDTRGPCSVLDKGPAPPREGEIWGRNNPIRSDADYRPKLLWSLLLLLLFSNYNLVLSNAISEFQIH